MILGGKMTTGEIISIIAVCISFLGLIISFLFSYKKADREQDKERELNVKNITTLNNNIERISEDTSDIKHKLERIDEKINSDHEKIVEIETRVVNLEKTIFKKGA